MSENRPRLLVLTKLAPWRLNGGALIRNYWMIRALTQRFSVDLFTSDDAPPPPEVFGQLLNRCEQFPRQTGFGGKIHRALSALQPDMPLYATGSVTPQLIQAVTEAVSQNDYAALQCDLNMFGAVPRNLQIPLIYNAHNCEYALQLRRTRAEFACARNVAARIIPTLMALDAKRLGRFETHVLSKASLIASCSDADIADFHALLDEQGESQTRTMAHDHLRQTAVIVPNGVDTVSYAALATKGSDERTLLVTGSMDWRPNRMGLQWFLDEVLPQLRKRASSGSFRIRVAGRMDERLVRQLSEYPEITAIPNPDRMHDELDRTTIVVAPITASSGTRLRILEAWAAQRPVVTTSHGALGLNYVANEEIVIRDHPAEFAETILELFDNPTQVAAISQAALKRVEEYDWQPIGAHFLKCVEALIATSTSAAT